MNRKADNIELDTLTDEDYLKLGKALVGWTHKGSQWASSVIARTSKGWEICDPGCGCCGGPDELDEFKTLRELIDSL